VRTSDSTKEIFAALVAANEDLTNPAKSQKVEAGRRSYSFAPLPEIISETRAILRKHGLALIQEAKADDGFAGVGTRLIHVSGEWIEYDPLFLPSALDAQSYGSAITYARRYAWTAALGIAADEDDDAQKATTRKKNQDSAAARTHSRATETWPEAVAAANVAAESSSSEGSGAQVPLSGAYGEGAQPDSSDSIEETLEVATLDAIVDKYGVDKALAAARRMGFRVTSLGQLTEEEGQKMLNGEVA
jgi:hypothetical protein